MFIITIKNQSQFIVLPVFVLPVTKLVLLIEVNEVTPHLPTVPEDLAAVGLLVFSHKSLSKFMAVCTTLFGLLEYFARPYDFM